MKIEILFRPPMRVWHRRLVDQLSAAGHHVRCAPVAGSGLPFAVAKALAVQRRIFGPSPSLFDEIRPPRADAVDPQDLVIALGGVATETEADASLEPLFEGVAGEAALLELLTGHGAPTIRLRARRQGAVTDLVVAIVAIEDRDILSRALDQMLARLVTLIVQAVRRFEQDLPPAVCADADPARRQTSRSPLAHMRRGSLRKLAGRLPGAKRGPNHWRIGYRRIAGTDVAAARTWPSQPFTILPDDDARFYADPTPFEHDGRSFLFFEDFPYATGKGVIGCVEIAVDGTASAPRTVLEQPCHLSYPLVLRHGGEIYMLPEMSASGRIQLFRADPFPDRWVPDQILLEGVVAGDATPVLHEGRWWMFATLSSDGGSTWDQLGLFHAPDLMGPWDPHADNPVLVDAGAARSAGAMWHENGVLMRVAQDCRTGYGRGLAICRVDRLDAHGYEQTIVARLDPPEGYEADGAHTLGRAGALEVIDLRFPKNVIAQTVAPHTPGSSPRTGT